MRCTLSEIGCETDEQIDELTKEYVDADDKKSYNINAKRHQGNVY